MKSSGGQEPTTEIAKGHKEEIEAAIKQRGGFTQLVSVTLALLL